MDLLDEKRFQKYLQSSQFVDVSWQRIREKLKEWKLIGVKFLATPAVIFLVILWRPFSWLRLPVKSVEFLYLFTVIFSIILVIGFIMNSIEERLALSRCHWDNDERSVVRDRRFEKKIAHLIDGLFFLSVGGVVGMLYWIA
ncbi:MAG: hypothetical protein KDD45_08520 [Bdellovibrionales bacterium]|nr:hypothetical protein [Bdellovibrionales bacterium]